MKIFRGQPRDKGSKKEHWGSKKRHALYGLGLRVYGLASRVLEFKFSEDVWESLFRNCTGPRVVFGKLPYLVYGWFCSCLDAGCTMR